MNVLQEIKGNVFLHGDDIINDLLCITFVHPVSEDVIDKLLNDRNLDRTIISNLINQDMIEEFTYDNKKFFIRKAGERYTGSKTDSSEKCRGLENNSSLQVA
ncbi:MAG: hypothetical protein PWP27_758 [Clostridiales bacterium]|nr:hypothetical protein [Clostridiales bacterium]